MGVQITIELSDLLEAGWTIYPEEYETYGWNDEIECEVPITIKYCVIKKGPYTFSSYVLDCFHADCNDWGSNKQMFIDAGLFDIQHLLR